MKAVIQKEVEIPVKRSREGHSSFGVKIDLLATIRELKPGDSFVIDDHRGREYALIFGKRDGISLTTRKEGERYRVWRKK